MSNVFECWPWHHWARQRPQATALIDDRAYSWRQLAELVDRLAQTWQCAGVTAGSGIGLCGNNSVPLLIAYLAALQCGARVLVLNPRLPSSLLTSRLPTLNIDYGWSQTAMCWPQGITPLVADDQVLTAGPTSGPVATAVHWDAQRLATLTLTSGSSGLPKAAAHTAAAHLGSAAGVIELMNFGPQHRWLLSLPLYHVSGQGIVWRWLAVGAGLVLRAGLPLPQALAGCSHASLVPTQLWRLLKQPADELTLEDVLLGGAMIPTELTRLAEARGIRCWCGYGLTEFASTVCAKRADGRAGVGLPLAGRALRLVNDEVWLRGNSMASGYWQQGQLIPVADADGWFATRDRGVMAGGELQIIGRLDNLFFCGGEGVQPEDIERLMAAHPGVRQALVLPVACEEYGQRPVAIVDGELELSALRCWLEPKLTPWQRPVAYLALPETFRQGGIKIVRRELALWLQQHYP